VLFGYYGKRAIQAENGIYQQAHIYWGNVRGSHPRDKNPLQGIKSCLQVIETGFLSSDDTFASLLNLIYGEIERINNINFRFIELRKAVGTQT
jgi:nitrogen-specific signal transduction histidine kinase